MGHRRFVGLRLLFGLAVAVGAFGFAGAAAPPVMAQDGPQFWVPMSPDNVVPGPGQAGAEDPYGYIWTYFEDSGVVCWNMDFWGVSGPTSAGLYQGAAGTNGTLVLTLAASWTHSYCVEGVDWSLVEAMAANPAGYYVQVNTTAYPEGATRAQLKLVVPQINVDVRTFLCYPGAKFGPGGNWEERCGSVALPGQGYQPVLGYTSIGYAGNASFDYRVQDAGGLDQTTAEAWGDGVGWCNTEKNLCGFSPWSYEWIVQEGPLTVTPLAAPAGGRLAYVEVITAFDSVIPWTSGPGGSINFDMTGRSEMAIVRVFYTIAPEATPPIELAPVAEVAGDPLANGEIPLTVQFGAAERGSGPITYQVQVQRDGGQFHMADVTTSAFLNLSEEPGHTYVFRVRAIDKYEVSSGWVVGAELTI